MLLKARADPDKLTLAGYTPLSLAARVSVARLPAFGVNTITLHCETLLSNVSTSSPSRCPSALSCLMAEATFLLAAVIQVGHAEVVQVLLNAGADPVKPAHEGWTPLALAAKVSAE